MSRTLLFAVALSGALFAAAPAHAKIAELGRTAESATPSCPGKPCLAVARTTGYQAKVGTERGIFTVPRRGRIVAWTVSLAEPTRKQIRYFDKTFGGEPSAGITVVRMGDRLSARVKAQSPVEDLSGYLGRTVQFPLERTLKVRKGDVVALTVPTWAPALAVGYGNDTSWRATRGEDHCDETDEQTAQTEVGARTDFRCLYRTARLTYSATLITSPKPRRTSRR